VRRVRSALVGAASYTTRMAPHTYAYAHICQVTARAVSQRVRLRWTCHIICIRTVLCRCSRLWSRGYCVLCLRSSSYKWWVDRGWNQDSYMISQHSPVYTPQTHVRSGTGTGTGGETQRSAARHAMPRFRPSQSKTHRPLARLPSDRRDSTLAQDRSARRLCCAPPPSCDDEPSTPVIHIDIFIIIVIVSSG
jgi:hypothetical protein